ncbi:aromatic amino acid transport family protein [Cuneatibacter caecimuris]|uniref:Amino acid permease n=1 Tax=Cuneatibacter caecimuris TaxID=1796618 RepID=A0A4V2F7P1_9FIRM|nr:aromatic amino acid transport family protein [Cuneatibacter caecimuris]RZT00500.1 amino acid permease [Cuneatibacter caecimuris]
MGGMKSEAKLTFGEATSLIVGHGVGSGILSVPYLASRNSWFDLIWVVAAVYGINLLLHFMIAELSYHNGGAQFIKCFENELFVGRLKKILTWGAFALLGFSVLVNVSGFITGASAVLVSWLGIPEWLGMVLFYMAAAAVVFAGMKLVGICEKFAVGSMALVMVILLVATLTGKIQDFRLQFVSMGNVLALYSMVSFSLSAVMSVPQVVKGLDGDPRRIKGAIAAGTGINLLLILVITVTTLLGAGNNISENGALVDLSKELGGWVSIVGYVFSLLALATSFWANTLNLRDVVCEQTRWGTRAGWALSSFPCLLIALMGITSFVGFVRLASIVQVLTGIGVIVAYHRARKREGFSPICGRLGGLPLQILVVAGSLAATVGALLKIS